MLTGGLPQLSNKHSRNYFAHWNHPFEMTIGTVLCICVLFHADSVKESIAVFAAEGVFVVLVDGTWRVADTLWPVAERGAVLFSGLVLVVV